MRAILRITGHDKKKADKLRTLVTDAVQAFYAGKRYMPSRAYQASIVQEEALRLKYTVSKRTGNQIKADLAKAVNALEQIAELTDHDKTSAAYIVASKALKRLGYDLDQELRRSA